jgi:hypothetical protein
MAQMRDEDPKPKTEVCKGLKVISEGNQNYDVFQLFSYVASIRAAGKPGVHAIVANWKSMMTDFWSTQLSPHIHGKESAEVVNKYSNCRDDLARWFATCPDLTLTTKEEWATGYALLFNLLDVVSQIRKRTPAGKFNSELRSEFWKPNACIDICTKLDTVFQFKGGKPGAASSDNQSSRRVSYAQRNKNKSPNAKAGHPTPTGATGERACHFCKK